MKQYIAASILASLLLCTGCEPTVFGMPQSQFNQLNDEQKQIVIDNYNQQQERKAELAPLVSAIGALGAAEHAGKTVPLSSSSECHMNGNTQVCNSSSSSVHFGW